MIGKLTISFFKKVSHGVYSNPDTQEGGGGGGQEQGFRGCFTDWFKRGELL